MLDWEIKNNIISKLFIRGENIIKPWGFETADSLSFFSLEENVGYRYKVVDNKIENFNKYLKSFLHIKMSEGEWNLEDENTIINDKCILRKTKITCLTDSIFMDFVMRFRFISKYIESIEIDGNILFHKNTNIYNQFETNEIIIRTKFDYNITIKVLEVQTNNKFKPIIYARDYKDEWVVHLRMLPISIEKEVIKLSSKWFKTKPINQAISNHILKNNYIKNKLYYRSENNPYQSKILRIFNPNAYPMAKVLKNEQLLWKSEFSLND